MTKGEYSDSSTGDRDDGSEPTDADPDDKYGWYLDKLLDLFSLI